MVCTDRGDSSGCMMSGESQRYLLYLQKLRIMRLQKKEIQTILQVAKSIYGERVKVYLFGSRLDNTKRGGDIDLLIRTDEAKKGVLARIRMIAQLKYLLGDQKIDIIGDHEDSIVVQEALQKGVLLV